VNETDLEQKFLFRLIKVLYILALFLGIAFFGIIGWQQIPTKYVDISKSYVSCPNGKQYLMSAFSIYSQYYINPKDDLAIKRACVDNVVQIRNKTTGETKEINVSDLSLYGIDESTKLADIKYNTVYVESISGSWTSAILWWGLGYLGIYIVLNIIRETLNYIFFGRVFQLDWLAKIITFAKGN